MSDWRWCCRTPMTSAGAGIFGSTGFDTMHRPNQCTAAETLQMADCKAFHKADFLTYGR